MRRFMALLLAACAFLHPALAAFPEKPVRVVIRDAGLAGWDSSLALFLREIELRHRNLVLTRPILPGVMHDIDQAAAAIAVHGPRGCPRVLRRCELGLVGSFKTPPAFQKRICAKSGVEPSWSTSGSPSAVFWARVHADSMGYVCGGDECVCGGGGI